MIRNEKQREGWQNSMVFLLSYYNRDRYWLHFQGSALFLTHSKKVPWAFENFGKSPQVVSLWLANQGELVAVSHVIEAFTYINAFRSLKRAC